MKHRLQIDVAKMDRRMTELGWDDARLVAETHLTEKTIRNVRKGDSHSPGTLWAIAGALDVKVIDIAKTFNGRATRRRGKA